MNCECEKCKACCERNPGWFGTLEEVKGAAEIKKMSLRDFAQEFLIREWCAGEEEEIDIPAPRRNFEVQNQNSFNRMFSEIIEKNKKGFVKATWAHNLLFGYPCIFFKNGKCEIHNSKPLECREVFGCKESTFRRDSLLKYWKEHQKEMVEWRKVVE